MDKFTYNKWYWDMDLNGDYFEFEIANRNKEGTIGGIWYVLFDKKDYSDELVSHSWRIKTTSYGANYAITSIKKENGKWGSVGMHNLIMGYKDDLWIDHINGDTLDNRRSNLRFITKQHNAVNRRGTKGYYLNKEKYRQNKPWFAYIFVNGKQIWLGSFKTELEAKEARSVAENKYYPNVKYR